MGASQSSGWSMKRDIAFSHVLERLFLHVQASLQSDSQYDFEVRRWLSRYDIPNILDALDWVSINRPELKAKSDRFRKVLINHVTNVLRSTDSTRRHHEMVRWYLNFGAYKHPVHSDDVDEYED